MLVVVDALHRDAGGGIQDPAAYAAHLGGQHHRLIGVRADEHQYTTFIQQGNTMNISILSVSLPLALFEVACVWVMLYRKVIVPAMRLQFLQRRQGCSQDFNIWGAWYK
jgi:hypothetical protein